VDLKIKVIPKSSRNEIAGRLPDGTLRVKVAAPPEKGKANAELRSFLARRLGVAKSAVTIVAGEASHHKVVRVEGGESGWLERLRPDGPET